MKKLKYIFLLAGALSLASCESWLDEDPQYTINTKTQFSTVENARQALMAGSNIWILWFWMVTNEWQFYRFIGLYGRRN